MRFDDFTHFVRQISSSEAIVISRPKTNIVVYFTSFSYLFLALLAIWFFYKSAQHSGEGKTFGQIWKALIKVCTNDCTSPDSTCQ